MNLKIDDIIAACGGRLINDAPTNAAVTSISTNTRTLSPGALFVPIVGENFDGHDYIAQAAENGAICVLSERQSQPTDMGLPIIYVSSTRRALMDLADFYRRKHDVRVVAVTGSAGKTTTKDMIAAILAMRFKTKRTIGNFNNDIGMPLSIFRLETDDEALVLEMGMNHANEIHELSLVGVPDFAVITHIGDAHIENFENREGILHAKLEIVDGLRPGGTVVLNGDDPLLTGPIAAEKTAQFNVLFPSSKNIISAEMQGFGETHCRFEWQGKEIAITVPLPGAHMVMNALLATVVGLEMGITPAEIAQAFANFVPAEGRLNILELANMTIIDDVYNANPASMFEALKVLCSAQGAQPKPTENVQNSGILSKPDTPVQCDARRRIAVLGDMNELGHVAKPRHCEVGEFAAQVGVDLLISIGELSRHIHDGFCAQKPPAEAKYFATLEEFLPTIPEIFRPSDIILLKASRTMNFERIIQNIK